MYDRERNFCEAFLINFFYLSVKGLGIVSYSVRYNAFKAIHGSGGKRK